MLGKRCGITFTFAKLLKATIKSLFLLQLDVTVGYVVVKWFNKPDESHVNRLLEVLHEYPKIIAFVGFVADYRDVIQSASFVSSIRFVNTLKHCRISRKTNRSD